MPKATDRTKEIYDTYDKNKERLEARYMELSDKLRNEKDRLTYELRHDYRNARRYIRAHPEQGVGFAFAGGILIGYILARLTK